jgi:hypothetical protein
MPFAYYKWPLLAPAAIDIRGAISQLRRANGYLHLMLSGHVVIFTLLSHSPNAMILAAAFFRCGQAKAIELIGNKKETNEAQIAEQSFCSIWQCESTNDPSHLTTHVSVR